MNLDESMLLKSYYNRRLINARQNSLFKNGKIYKVTFDNEMVYVGSTCNDPRDQIKLAYKK